jgi:hypothetical protein
MIISKCRTESCHDFTWFLVEKSNHLSNDSWFGCRWNRTNWLWIILIADDCSSFRQRY